MTMLRGYRVLDLTDDRGQLAGAMLAALGAEVILVEPPEGAASRRRGPFAEREAGPGPSLSHWAHNRGKRGIVLDLAGSDHDRDELRRLAAGADVLLESGEPGALAAVGLGPDDLLAANPALVVASVTPFGQDGPKARWATTDLTAWAAGMALTITGDADRAPVRVSVPQAFLHAAADAAVGVLVALAERARSGAGQHVDVSAQQSVLQATQASVLTAPLRATPARRMAGGVRVGPLDVQLLWPCKDGYVTITFLFGAHAGPFTRLLMEWVHDEGHCDAATRDKDWVDYGALLFTGVEPIEEYERVKRCVESFTRTKTKAELFAAALERRLPIAPASTVADLVAMEHFRARGYWDEIEDPDLSPAPIRCPGPFATLSRTPLTRLGRAPRLGEHTAEVLAEPPRPPAPAAAAAPASTTEPPLAGLKVLDLCWVLAGPTMGRVLADYGATVIKVESATKVEAVRTLTPFVDDALDPERSGLFCNTNAGKLGFSLNLSNPASRDVLLDLVRWADVVTESFAPRALREWGLGYEQLREVNPSLVMVSSCLMGQTGPLSEFAGTGNMAAAVMGFYSLTGWPDRWPAGPFGAYTDYVAPRFGLAALLAALDHRRRTGEGQYIDFSQAEASIHFLSSAVLDHTVNDRVADRCGNADAEMAPHGVYAAAGDDAWVALACATDDQWRALTRLLGRPELAEDAALATAEGRRARAAELDAIVEAWTRERTPGEVTERCQAAGIPAHGAATSDDCWDDPQLRQRGHFVEVDHDVLGRVVVEGSRMRLSRTPARVTRGAPTIGEHTSYVLTELLGYDDERVGDLYAAEALE